MRVDLDLSLPIFRLRQVLLELYADELPLISLFCDLGRRHVLEDLFNVRVFLCGIVSLSPHDRITTIFLELKPQVKLLAFLRTMVRVHE